MATRAYKYGCPSWFQPEGALLEQLKLANGSQNALVRAHLDHQDAKKRLWRSVPALAPLMEDLDAALDVVGEVLGAIREARIEGQTTDTGTEMEAQLAKARKRAKAARAALRAAQAEALGQVEGLQEQFAAEHERRFGNAATRRFYAEQRQLGLGWGTFGDIRGRRFLQAKSAVASRRAQGLPAQIHFQAFSRGTLVVQIQRERGVPATVRASIAAMRAEGVKAGDIGKAVGLPARTVARIKDEGPERPADAPFTQTSLAARNNVAWLSPEAVEAPPRRDGTSRRRASKPSGAYRSLRLRVAPGCHVTIPVVWHRDMPDAAEIKEIRVVCRRVAAGWRTHVVFACIVPSAESAPGSPLVVEVRPASASDGGWLRAARIEAAFIPPPPASLERFIRVVSPSSAEVWLPPEIRTQFMRVEGIQGVRSRLLWDQRFSQDRTQVRASVAAALAAEPAFADALAAAVFPRASKDGTPVTGDSLRRTVQRTRSERLMARIARNWRLLRDDGWLTPFPAVSGAALYPPEHTGRHQCRCAPDGHDLRCWQKRDKHLWEFQAHLRDQVCARRRDVYRNVAAWVCSFAGAVDIAPVGQRGKPRPGSPDTIPGLEQAGSQAAADARSNASAAAPGELAEAIRQAAGKHGIQVGEIKKGQS